MSLQSQYTSQSISSVEKNVDVLDQVYPNFNELDPSQIKDFVICYMQEVKFQIQIQTGFEKSAKLEQNMEPINVKILHKKHEKTKHLQEVRIELTTEIDLFFNFSCTITQSQFNKLKAQQKLNVDFDQLDLVLIKMFTSCKNDPTNFVASFVIGEELYSTLTIYQLTEYRTINIINLDFQALSEDAIKQNVMYRFNTVKSKIKLVGNRTQEIFGILKNKNKELFEHVQKNTSLVKKAR